MIQNADYDISFFKLTFINTKTGVKLHRHLVCVQIVQKYVVKHVLVYGIENRKIKYGGDEHFEILIEK